jgi:hypothetical protein
VSFRGSPCNLPKFRRPTSLPSLRFSPLRDFPAFLKLHFTTVIALLTPEPRAFRIPTCSLPLWVLADVHRSSWFPSHSGAASREFLRPGGTAGFCFGFKPPCRFPVAPQKNIELRSLAFQPEYVFTCSPMFSGSPRKKHPLPWGAVPLAFGRPE